MASCRDCNECPYLQGVKNAEKLGQGPDTEYFTKMMYAIDAQGTHCTQRALIMETLRGFGLNHF